MLTYKLMSKNKEIVNHSQKYRKNDRIQTMSSIHINEVPKKVQDLFVAKQKQNYAPADFHDSSR